MKTTFFLTATLVLSFTFFAPLVFAESSNEEKTSSQRMDKCEYYLQYPNDLHSMCMYKRSCEGLEFTNEDRKTVLEEDYLIQLFLQNNPWASLLRFGAIGNFDIENPWLVGSQNYNQYKNMGVSLNACSDITRISYQDLRLAILEQGNDGKALLDVEEEDIIDSVVSVGEGKYKMAKRIIGNHLSPKIQVDEFGIPPNKIQCRDGLVQVFKKSDNFPACVTHDTAKKLVERNWTKSDKDGLTVSFSFCGADGFYSDDNLNKSNSTHTWDENYCEWTKNTIPKNNPAKYSETIIDNNPYNNELIIFQKDSFAPLQYNKTKQVIDETFLSKTAGEWQKVSRDVLMEEHEKYLPEHRFFDHLGSFLIKNEFQNIMNELGIVNVENDFEVKNGMSLTSLPPHNSYYSIIKATDGNYYRLQGGTHANEVNVSKVSALLFFDTSTDFKMEDLVSTNQLFTILPENNNKPEIEPSNLIIHTNNSKVEFYNNTPEVIRIQDSGTGRVGEEHLLGWVGPTILPYTTASMTFDEPGNFDFNARFAPNLENPLWWSTHTRGTIIVMSDDMSSVSREEKNKMAQSLLFDLGLPVVGAGTGNADNVLSVQLDPSIVEIIPNATQYYKERIEQIFPFEIVLDMGY